MATPPTRVLGVTPSVGWSSTATPKTSPTFDVQDGDLIVLLAFTENGNTSLNLPTWTGTGTWTLRESINLSTSWCTAYLYTCAVTATQTGRTISQTRSSTANQWGFYASVWRNHGGLGVSGKANVSSGAPSLALSAAANSAIVVGNSDWNAISGSSRVWRTVNGTALVETSFGGTAGVTYTNYTGYSADVGTAGSKTVGLTAPTGQKYSIVGIEVLGAAGGSSFSGSIGLSGSGSLTQAGAPAFSLPFALSGSGSLTQVGSASFINPFALGGSGVLGMSSIPAIAASLGLTGDGTLGLAGSPVYPSTDLDTAGEGTLSFFGSAKTSESLGTTGSGILALSGEIGLSSSVDFSGTATLVMAGTPAMSGDISLSGVGTLSLSGGIPSASGNRDLVWDGIAWRSNIREDLVWSGSGWL